MIAGRANVSPSHPEFGDQLHEKFDFQWNRCIDGLYQHPEILEMFYRHLRTQMDDILAGTYYEDRVDELVGLRPDTRWLDFGCGNGGLVRYVREHRGCNAVGFDEGAIIEAAAGSGIPIVKGSELDRIEGQFDVVTAIEVLEHVADPVAELRRIRALLRPGGLLFLTTANAEPFAEKLDKWPYVIPEIHISFFEPRTLTLALGQAGFRPERISRGRGFNEILKYKVLKNLGMKRRTPLTAVVPARPVAAVADRYAALSQLPVGWAV